MIGEDDRAFGMRDTVCLVDRHGDIPAASIGTVLGWFVYEGTYIVNFRDEGRPPR